MLPKVMIVDDSLFIRHRLTRLLTEHGYDTIQAQDGVQAVGVYRSAQPDVVLMDITMPHQSGLDALIELRCLDPQVKVIILTALDQESIVARAIDLGAEDFLVKPVSASQLLDALGRVLR